MCGLRWHLSYAEAIAKGKRAIEYQPLPSDGGYDDPTTEYAQMIEVNRQMYPSLDIVPADPTLYVESAGRNETLVANRLKQLEKEMRELGALVGNDEVPEKLVSGTLHEALDGYASEIERDGAKLENGTLKQYPFVIEHPHAVPLVWFDDEDGIFHRSLAPPSSILPIPHQAR